MERTIWPEPDERTPVRFGPNRVDNALVFTVAGYDGAAAEEGIEPPAMVAVRRYVAEFGDAGASLISLDPELSGPVSKERSLEMGAAGGAPGRPSVSGTYHLRLAEPSHGVPLVARLRADPSIRRMYRPVIHYPLGAAPALASPAPGPQWALDRCHFPQVWADLDYGSVPGPLAIIDQGTDYHHPELNGRITSRAFTGAPSVPSQSIHAGAVAGIIAASRTDGGGISGCCSAQVDLYNVWSATRYESAAFYEALRLVAGSTARVVNLSIGSKLFDPIVKARIAACVAKGIIVVAAMGNDAKNGNPLLFPAAYPDVIAVGATNRFDGKTQTSSTGAHIHISAPGEGILTLAGGAGFQVEDGTSYAAPMVASAVWLMLRVRPCWGLSQVKTVLAASGIRRMNSPVFDTDVGHGRLDMVRLLAEVKKRPCGHPGHTQV